MGKGLSTASLPLLLCCRLLASGAVLPYNNNVQYLDGFTSHFCMNPVDIRHLPDILHRMVVICQGSVTHDSDIQLPLLISFGLWHFSSRELGGGGELWNLMNFCVCLKYSGADRKGKGQVDFFMIMVYTFGTKSCYISIKIWLQNHPLSHTHTNGTQEQLRESVLSRISIQK